MKYQIDQSFRCASVERFIDVYFSEGFNNAVSPHIGLKRRELVEQKQLEDGRIERRVRMEPTVQLPPALKKIVGNKVISYDEVSTFDPASNKADYWVDSAIKDRLEVKGTVEFLPDGDGRVRRVIHAEVNARVIGLRGIIEKLIRREVESSYQKIAAFMQRYLDELGDEPVEPATV